jgi:LysM repeat protein
MLINAYLCGESYRLANKFPMYPANFLFLALIFFFNGLSATAGSFSQQDSLILHTNSQGRLVVLHTIDADENAKSLIDYYQTDEQTFYSLNPHLRQAMSRGAIAQIPVNVESIVTSPPPANELSFFTRVYYRVQKGDTAFGISRRLFSMPTDTLLQRNKISSQQIRIGQTLFIGWIPSNRYTLPERNYAASKEALTLEQLYRQAEEEKTIMVHRGPAIWSNNNQNGMFALHRYAPMDAVIKVTNPVSRQTVYLKVVGRIPDSIYGDEVVAIISFKAARLLRGVDQRFYVTVHYPER